MNAITGLLGFFPGWMWAIACAALTATACVKDSALSDEREAHAGTKTTLATERAGWADERAAAAMSALRQSENHRRLEQELQHVQEENAAQAQALLQASLDAAFAAELHSQQLRSAAADLAAVARTRCAAASAPGYSTPGPDAIGVLADVLGRADARAGELAAIADERRIRGLACEREYDAARKALSG